MADLPETFPWRLTDPTAAGLKPPKRRPALIRRQ
jgi:hypothetical protein